jgi:hypothetical protein
MVSEEFLFKKLSKTILETRIKNIILYRHFLIEQNFQFDNVTFKFRKNLEQILSIHMNYIILASHNINRFKEFALKEILLSIIFEFIKYFGEDLENFNETVNYAIEHDFGKLFYYKCIDYDVYQILNHFISELKNNPNIIYEIENLYTFEFAFNLEENINNLKVNELLIKLKFDQILIL